MVATDALEEQYVARALRSDRIFAGTVRASTGIFVAVVAGLFMMLVLGSWPAIHTFGLRFLDQ